MTARTRREGAGRVPCLSVLCVLCVLLAAAPPEPFDPAKPLPDDERDRRLEQVRPGLPPDQVRDLLGPPKRVARQILYQRYLEQWVYDAPFDLRVEFECRRGQQPQVQSVQPLRPTRP
jgi:hypothetical protein